MQTKIRVGAVSYLNTKPLIYGFEHGMMKDEIDLLIDYPSKIAYMLLENKIDVGLVPVAVIPKMKEHHIISDYCIGCDGEVASVCLFSNVPLEKIEKVLLDYQSRSSVALLKILIKEYWKINVVFEETSGDYQSGISGTTAALVIGDRALQQRKISPYIYDLGLAWKRYTRLPFMFAAWISNKKLDKNFIRSFNEANSFGLNKIAEVVAENPFEAFDLKHYYTDCISFDLGENKKQGLKLFLDKMKASKILMV
ncbi:MAG: menaquinone biosynthesis protein [Bacteroidota bacterium]|nr:menaquinone biosynthesis protein [Bacteroidota bacterium]